MRIISQIVVKRFDRYLVLGVDEQQKQIEKIIKNYKHYQEKLLQVTQKNRSVSLKKIYSKHNFDLVRLEEIKKGTVEKIVLKTIKNISYALNDSEGEGQRQNILLDSLEGDEADLTRAKLKKLSRNLRQIEEETSQQTGYLGFPFIQGHPISDFYVRGPLVLFPISLYQKRQVKNGGWFLQFSDKRPILNGALITALKKKGEYVLPEDYETTFDEMIEDISNVDMQNMNGQELDRYFLEKISRWVSTIIPIEDTKNQTQAVILPQLKRDDIDNLDNQPLHIVNYKIIGNFPQADNEIYNDYNVLINKAAYSNLGVLGKIIDIENPDTESQISDDTYVDIDSTNDVELNTVLESDSSQDKVILESKNSDLVVVRGPPGTGKSQVIVNLISDALTNNKKILVVCQKRAALEVVKQRLEKVNLARYVIFLEKEIDDRKKMYRQLLEIIESEPQTELNMELSVQQMSGNIDECVQYLSNLGNALKKKYFGGVTAHKIYSRGNGNYSHILDLSSTDFNLEWSAFNEYLQKIQNIENTFKKFENMRHPWFGRKDFSNFGIMDKSKLERGLDTLIQLASSCVLANNYDEQSRLPDLCKRFLDNLQSLKAEDARLSEQISTILGQKTTESFIRDNFEAVQKGVEFWSVFSKLLGLFDTEKQTELVAMTANSQSLVSHLASMKNIFEESETIFAGIKSITDLNSEEKNNLKDWLAKLTELTPQCMLVSKAADQDKLCSLFDSYLNHLQSLKAEDARLSEQISTILGQKTTESFIRDNFEAVQKGVEFWSVFSKLLGLFDTEKQGHLLSMTADNFALASYIDEIKSTLRTFDDVWFRRNDLYTLGIDKKNNLKDWLAKLTDITPQCMLVSKAADQDKLCSLFDSYLNNAGFLGSKKRKISKQISTILGQKTTESFIRDNFEAVQKGVEFWSVFSKLLGLFDTEKQGHLLSMTTNTQSLTSYLQEMLDYIEEENTVWFYRKIFNSFNRIQIKDWLAKLTDITPQCMLVSKAADQDKLCSLFDSYLNNAGFLGSKKRKISKQISTILGQKTTESFIRDNFEAVQKGVEFWSVFSKLLGLFDTEKQTELVAMTANSQSLVSHLASMKNIFEESESIFAGIKSITDLNSEEKNNLKDWLAKLTELTPQCMLVSKAADQDKLCSLFDSYLNHLQSLKAEDARLSEQISTILGQKTTESFILDNFEAVQNGVEFWSVFSKLLGLFDTEKQTELVAMTANSQSLVSHLASMKNIFEESESIFAGIKSITDLNSEEKNNLKDWLAKLTELTPQCMLVSKAADQDKLCSLFDSYLNHLQSLKAEDARLSEQISTILGQKTTESFILDNFEAVQNGVEFWSVFRNILDVFEIEQQNRLITMTKDAQLITLRLEDMKHTFEFDAMQEFDRNKRSYDSSIIQILNQVKDNIDTDANWTEIIKQEIYTYWLARIEQENPILKGEPISNYEKNRNNLARLMEHKQTLVQKSIQQKIESVIHPEVIYSRGFRYDYDWKDFSRELKRKRRVKPVRKMFEIYSSNMFAIAPCWLASPESVSKVFPLERDLFDLVIVDEASQLAVERAIPFLYRAKHVVIAGDEKQLPPFDLFQINEDDSDEEDEDISDEKSLLDLARARYKTNELSWHYRSKYQDLINFSNHAFYEGNLNVAPNAVIDPSQPPIRWIQCNGMWNNHINLIEADRVVDEIANVWEKSERHDTIPSVGVITFNEKQQEIINDIIDRRRDSDPAFGSLYGRVHSMKKERPLFVKNIENVQGDERDIIIFSIGYAKDSEGKFTNIFGTLNRKGGENRLNVAITRARKEMIVICSIEPTEIKLTSKHEGPKMLRRFLEYAKATDSLDNSAQETVISEINSNMQRINRSKHEEFDSDFEVQVCQRLREKGHTVETQIGFSGYKIDLAIVHPDQSNRYVLGIECDGATFHSAKSVRERDVMRQKFLEEKGWVIERIWSRNWWKNPSKEIDRLDARIRELTAKTE